MASNPTVAHERGALAESASGWCHTASIGCVDMVTSMRRQQAPAMVTGPRVRNHKESTPCP